MIQRKSGLPRVSAALAVVGCVVAGVSVAAAAEPKADQLVKAQASTWDKPAVAVQTGEKVTWDLNSNDNQFHNVKGTANPADPNYATLYVLPAREGTVSYTFTQPGAYEFVCEVHSGTMRGTVTVTGAPTTPTATPSTTPSTTPTSTPTPTATASTAPPAPQPTTAPSPSDNRLTPAPSRGRAADTTKPMISKLKLKAVRRGARVSFSLSETSSVTIRFKRGKSTVRTVRLSARAGTRSLTVRSSRLTKARYSVEIEARDARGNRADVQRKNVRITR
jgi:plastocyanin